MVPFFSVEILLVFIGFLPFSLSQSGVFFQNIATKKGCVDKSQQYFSNEDMPLGIAIRKSSFSRAVGAVLGFRLPNEYVLKIVPATSVVQCGFLCLDEECCASITYHDASSEINQKNCHLNNVFSLNYSGSLLRDEHANYYELVDVYNTLNRCWNIKCQNEGHRDELTGNYLCPPGYGGRSSEIYPRSCLEIKTLNNESSSGVYWIQVNSSDGVNANTTLPFQVYCDMNTHGGGWTLVYSYTFTNYNNFFSDSNAVTPRPAWSASDADVEISNVAPLNETALGAMNFELWQNIGEEFLIKSNINDWIVCNSDTGSLVREVDGSLSCINIKNVATACEGVQPSHISWQSSCGPRLYATTSFYRFDGSKNNCYPSHDPCNSGDTVNHKRNVLNPGGEIFLR